MSLHFEPITMNRQKDYLKYLSKMTQKTSDYSFVNIRGWAEEYALTWAFTDHLLWIKQAQPEEQLWAPVGDWHLTDWPAVFKDIALPVTFTRIPEKLIAIWKDCLPLSLEIIDERDHWDYIYSTKDLIELRGNRYHKKKNLLNQFVKKYDYQYHTVTPERIDETLAMQEDWCSWRNCESDDTLSSENRAIENVLKSYRAYDNICGGSILVNQLITAYTIGEFFSEDTMLIHFEKGCPMIKGAYQAINQFFLKNEASDTVWVNREQDIGDAGLRKAKLSYHPSFFLKKYRVNVNDTTSI
ncbi:MAG: DUF2156 domain-containing protein [Candidatus Magnetomorum sp.]|nr:DUF2156 domain-containing protein [Candidatus Magnetomorum sp.]